MCEKSRLPAARIPPIGAAAPIGGMRAAKKSGGQLLCRLELTDPPASALPLGVFREPSQGAECGSLVSYVASLFSAKPPDKFATGRRPGKMY